MLYQWTSSDGVAQVMGGLKPYALVKVRNMVHSVSEENIQHVIKTKGCRGLKQITELCFYVYELLRTLEAPELRTILMSGVTTAAEVPETSLLTFERNVTNTAPIQKAIEEVPLEEPLEVELELPLEQDQSGQLSFF